MINRTKAITIISVPMGTHAAGFHKLDALVVNDQTA